jgi:hypothetical protein
MNWKKTNFYFVLQALKQSGSLTSLKNVLDQRNEWLNSFKPGRSSVSDESTWLTQFAIDFIEKEIKEKDRVFEFGGGGSTLFFCKNVQEVITVENHKGWFDILADQINEKGINNWTGHFIEAEKYEGLKERSPGNPDDFMSGAKGMEELSFEQYARTIEQYPKEYFDWVLVDGRARPSCLKLSIPHVKTGGYLILDNSDRSYYLKNLIGELSKSFEVILDKVGPTLYTPDFTKTTIFQKR